MTKDGAKISMKERHGHRIRESPRREAIVYQRIAESAPLNAERTALVMGEERRDHRRASAEIVGLLDDAAEAPLFSVVTGALSSSPAVLTRISPAPAGTGEAASHESARTMTSQGRFRAMGLPKILADYSPIEVATSMPRAMARFRLCKKLGNMGGCGDSQRCIRPLCCRNATYQLSQPVTLIQCVLQIFAGDLPR
jgi:hypothetical protein